MSRSGNGTFHPELAAEAALLCASNTPATAGVQIIFLKKLHCCCTLSLRMKFDKKLKKWLKTNKFTQQQGAAHLGVPFRTFQEWLAGMKPHADRQAAVEARMANFQKGA